MVVPSICLQCFCTSNRPLAWMCSTMMSLTQFLWALSASKIWFESTYDDSPVQVIFSCQYWFPARAYFHNCYDCMHLCCDIAVVDAIFSTYVVGLTDGATVWALSISATEVRAIQWPYDIPFQPAFSNDTLIFGKWSGNNQVPQFTVSYLEMWTSLTCRCRLQT